MADAEDLDRLHDHWHELRKAVDATSVTVAVIQERQKGQSAQLTRIETALIPLPQQVAVLEARQADATASGGKWGGIIGGIVAAVIGGIVALFGGSK